MDIWKKSLLNEQHYLFFKFYKPRTNLSYNRNFRVPKYYLKDLILLFCRLHTAWCGTHQRYRVWPKNFEQKRKQRSCLQSQLSLSLSDQCGLSLFHLWHARWAKLGKSQAYFWKIQRSIEYRTFQVISLLHFVSRLCTF